MKTVKRTGVDFSKHELKITQLSGKTGNASSLEGAIYDLKVPGTVQDRVRFMNIGGIMAVNGDYGNWIFCREFYPTKDGRVDDNYWCEKLRIASTQEPEEYDKEATRKEIEERLAEEDVCEEEREYFEELLEMWVDETEEVYLMNAHGSIMPNSMDHEGVPHCKKVKNWLKAVFDAFEEVCSRMPAAEKVKP